MSLTDAQRQSLAAKDPRYARLFGIATPVRSLSPAKPVHLPLLPDCEHLGGGAGCRLRGCNAGHGNVRPCDSCGPKCADYDAVGGNGPLPGLKPLFTHTFAGLHPDPQQLNCSLIPFRGRLLLAYRTGWYGSHVHIADIAPDYSVITTKTLNLRHPASVGGREDPRLFVHGDQLHMAYVGCRVPSPGAKTIVRQLFARLDDGLNVVEEWEPTYERSRPTEKNWQPFSHDGRLFAVYSMSPWQVVELADGRAEPLPASPAVPWAWGMPRGGAAPVRHGNEYYAFFHGTTYGDVRNPRHRYTVGVCTFEAEFPFRPKRITREPILWPVYADAPAGWYSETVFPCGAYLDGDRWVMSYGHVDHWCRAAGFDASEIENRLVPL